MAGEVLSTTSNYGKGHIDAQIRDKLISLGNDVMVIGRFAQQETIRQGVGDTIRFLQVNPIDLPTTQLTEASDPDKTSSTITFVEATVDHWGIIVGVSERLKIFTQFDVLQAHVMVVGRAMGRKREQEHVDVALAGTNVIYAGTATARNNLTSTDTFTTTEIRKALSNLFKTDGAKGMAPRYPDGRYVCVLHGDLLFDLQSDSVWETAMTRQNLAKLESDPLMVLDWQGVRFYAANLFPEWENLGDATDLSDDEHDAVITYNDAPGGAAALDVYMSVVLTRYHKTRLFEEGIYIVDVSGAIGAAADNSITGTYPTNTNYLYNAYVGDDAAAQATATTNLALQEQYAVAGAQLNNAAAGFETLSAGVAPPAVWTAAGSEKIRAALFMGPEAFAVAKLQTVDPFIVGGPDSGNVLNLFTDIGAKWRDKSVITDQDYMVRVEAHTSQ